jgi:hypothetical protein
MDKQFFENMSEQMQPSEKCVDTLKQLAAVQNHEQRFSRSKRFVRWNMAAVAACIGVIMVGGIVFAFGNWGNGESGVHSRGSESYGQSADDGSATVTRIVVSSCLDVPCLGHTEHDEYGNAVGGFTCPSPPVTPVPFFDDDGRIIGQDFHSPVNGNLTLRQFFAPSNTRIIHVQSYNEKDGSFLEGYTPGFEEIEVFSVEEVIGDRDVSGVKLFAEDGSLIGEYMFPCPIEEEQRWQESLALLQLRSEYDSYPLDVDVIRFTLSNGSDEMLFHGLGWMLQKQYTDGSWLFVPTIIEVFWPGLAMGIEAGGEYQVEIPATEWFGGLLTPGTYRVNQSDFIISNEFVLQ